MKIKPQTWEQIAHSAAHAPLKSKSGKKIKSASPRNKTVADVAADSRAPITVLVPRKARKVQRTRQRKFSGE